MRRFFLLFAAFLLLTGCACAQEAPVLVDRINSPDAYPDFAFAPDAPLLEIYFPQMRDCDAALIHCGDRWVMIDCGSNRQAERVQLLLDYLQLDKIDLLINTHPHYDHLEAFGRLAQKVTFGEIAVCHGLPDDEDGTLGKVLAAAEKLGVPVRQYADGDVFELGGAVVTAYLKSDPDWSLNDRSAQLHIRFGGRTALFTADITDLAQRRLAEVLPSEVLDVDILKYPHHGKEDPVAAWWEALTPEFIVVTANNSKTEGKYFIATRHLPWTTSASGCLRIATDGTTWLVERLPVPLVNKTK